MLILIFCISFDIVQVSTVLFSLILVFNRWRESFPLIIALALSDARRLPQSYMIYRVFIYIVTLTNHRLMLYDHLKFQRPLSADVSILVLNILGDKIDQGTVTRRFLE